MSSVEVRSCAISVRIQEREKYGKEEALREASRSVTSVGYVSLIEGSHTSLLLQPEMDQLALISSSEGCFSQTSISRYRSTNVRGFRLPQVAHDWVQPRHHAISDVEKRYPVRKSSRQIHIIVADKQNDGNYVVIALQTIL
jgi:hypothetical protein